MRVLLILFAIFCFASQALATGRGPFECAWPDCDLAGGDAAMHDYCRNGGKGSGWNAAGSCYTSTCGDYNASGLATYATCTADATPDDACLVAGERIKTGGVLQDIVSATQATCKGGTIYLSNFKGYNHGIYPWRGCDTGACPTNETGEHYIRHIAMYGGRRLLGEGVDTDGPEINGRTGTWLLDDGGRDGSTGAPGEDPDGSGVEIASWNFRSGLYDVVRRCVPDGVTPGACNPGDALVAATQSETISLWGRSGQFTDDSDILNQTSFQTSLCLNNAVAGSGVCTGNRNTTCANDATCTAEGYGTCEGFVTALATDIAAGEDFWLAFVAASTEWDGTQAPYQHPILVHVESADTGAVGCTGDGRNVNIGSVHGAYRSQWFWPFDQQELDFSVSMPSPNVRVVDMDKYDQGGGYSYEKINFMPQNWFGRNSSDNTEDCLVSDGTEAACDSGEMFGLYGGWKGGFNDITIWYASTEGFSNIDGSALGVMTKFHNTLYSGGKRGLVMDASMWDLRGNTWKDHVWPSNGMITMFSHGAVFRDQTFIGNRAMWAFNLGTTNGAWIDDVTFFSGNKFDQAVFKAAQGHFNTISNIRDMSTTGRFLVVSPSDDDTVAHLTVRDSVIAGSPNVPHRSDLGMFGGMYARAVILITDELSGDDGVTAGIENLIIDNVRAQGYEDSCFLWVDAGEDDAAGGAAGDLGMEDEMGEITVMNSSFTGQDEVRCTGASAPWPCCTAPGAGVTCAGKFACFSEDDDAAAPLASDAADILKDFRTDATSRLPRLVNNTLNGLPEPEFPYRVQAAAGAGDCDLLPPGTEVAIYDDTAAGACTDAGANGILDGGGAAISVCVCHADTTWTPLF